MEFLCWVKAALAVSFIAIVALAVAAWILLRQVDVDEDWR